MAPSNRVRDRPYGGRFVKDPTLTRELIDELRERGLLLREERYEHSYPHCWRCGTPLIYYAKTSWYIATSKLRDELLAANETVSWHPPHVKHGRFGDWLKNNVDWALSRERYWGTPLPVWRCPHGHTHTIGSFAELQTLSGSTLEDHHRPFVDEVRFPCPHADGGAGEGCGEPMERVPEVIDVWFDSGAMPFAQHHHPFEHEREFEQGFPADFICEAQDQTRGWFYSLLAISTLLDAAGAIQERGVPGSDPRRGRSEDVQVEGQHRRAVAGARHLWRGRLPLVLLHLQAPLGRLPLLDGRDRRGRAPVPEAAVATYFFYVLYAHASADELSEATAGSVEGARGRAGSDSDLDRWALSRSAGTAELVAERLDAYDATSAGRAIAGLVDELSNWYVRRSRRRFWDGDPVGVRDAARSAC